MDLLGRSLTRRVGRETIRPGGFMNILAAIKREEKKLESFGRFDQPETKHRKETSDVCGHKGEDFEGNNGAVGKV